MIENINELRSSLFQQDKEKTIELIISTIENMNKSVQKLSKIKIINYNKIMNKVEDFFIKGDYLTVSDIIKYELLPIFQEGN